jgi:hypothetical protein
MEKQYFKLHASGKVCEVVRVETNMIGGKGFDAFVEIIEPDACGVAGWNRQTWVAACRGEFVAAPESAPAQENVTFAPFALESTHGHWQVIFKTHSGLDYCRETMTGAATPETVKEWAQQQCRAHNLAGAVIDRF